VKVENAYERLRIAVEYDGEEFHSLDEDREHDEKRRDALRRAGWIIIVVRRDGLSGPGREAWLAELREAYADRAPSPLGKRTYARSPDSGPRRWQRR
jgi:very-short-patch-repair endonuclease